jgi:hypothetical protein
MTSPGAFPSDDKLPTPETRWRTLVPLRNMSDLVKNGTTHDALFESSARRRLQVPLTSGDELFIGGLPRLMFESLPIDVASRVGFRGCLASINLNGDTRSLRARDVIVPDEFHNDVIDGCQGTKWR